MTPSSSPRLIARREMQLKLVTPEILWQMNLFHSRSFSKRTMQPEYRTIWTKWTRKTLQMMSNILLWTLLLTVAWENRVKYKTSLTKLKSCHKLGTIKLRCKSRITTQFSPRSEAACKSKAISHPHHKARSPRKGEDWPHQLTTVKNFWTIKVLPWHPLLLWTPRKPEMPSLRTTTKLQTKAQKAVCQLLETKMWRRGWDSIPWSSRRTWTETRLLTLWRRSKRSLTKFKTRKSWISKSSRSTFRATTRKDWPRSYCRFWAEKSTSTVSPRVRHSSTSTTTRTR